MGDFAYDMESEGGKVNSYIKNGRVQSITNFNQRMAIVPLKTAILPAVIGSGTNWCCAIDKIQKASSTMYMTVVVWAIYK